MEVVKCRPSQRRDKLLQSAQGSSQGVCTAYVYTLGFQRTSGADVLLQLCWPKRQGENLLKRVLWRRE